MASPGDLSFQGTAPSCERPGFLRRSWRDTKCNVILCLQTELFPPPSCSAERARLKVKDMEHYGTLQRAEVKQVDCCFHTMLAGVYVMNYVYSIDYPYPLDFYRFLLQDIILLSYSICNFHPDYSEYHRDYTHQI